MIKTTSERNLSLSLHRRMESIQRNRRIERVILFFFSFRFPQFHSLDSHRRWTKETQRACVYTIATPIVEWFCYYQQYAAIGYVRGCEKMCWNTRS